MRCVCIPAFLLIAAGPTVHTDEAEKRCTVTGLVQVEGMMPTVKMINLKDDHRKLVGKDEIPDETWLVGKSNGLANCVITLHAVEKSKRTTPKPIENAVMEKDGARHSPRVLVVTSGAKVVFRNENNPCLGFIFTGFRNSQNFTVPKGTERTCEVFGPEFCSVTCGVRPYMKSWLCIVDTPYFAKTENDGRFTIANVPPGKYEVRVWHEAAGKLKRENGPVEVTLEIGTQSELLYKVPAPKE